MEGYSKAGQGHEEIQEEIEREFQDLARFLEAQFGIVKLDDKDHNLTVNVDGSTAVVDGVKFTTASEDETLLKRVSSVVQRARMSIKPIPQHLL
ncbi:hypothetical protein VTP01DRAFT_630 [Rhizomucor pusillus]|uniref:uncharacterized protein n=1 Tax=Rhizomucor pusillus TaxID=4840 RepID=UPI003742F8D1